MKRESRIVSFFRLSLAFVLFLAGSAMCGASNLVFIRAAATSAADQKQLELASQFYGLDLKMGGDTPAAESSALSVIRDGDTVAVVVDSHALSSTNQKTLLQALKRSNGASLPLLIVGLTSADAPAVLNRWSAGALQAVGQLAGNTGVTYRVGQVPEITDELSGVSLPYRGQAPYYLQLSAGAATRQVLGLQTDRGLLPALVEIEAGGQSIFFAAANTFARRDDQTVPGPDVLDGFTAIAPAMLFVKYAAGDRGWHAPQHFANLTIDDPWLHEPYGHLDYAGLLEEMRAHNFHTTIAFIPWNYARSTPEVAALFRDNPDRYSIAVHGDNHDHKEFEDFSSAPLAVQAPKLEQALARMDAFRKLTHIPYDRVFVFPHSIGEGPILRELKRDNYLATVNSTNVPMGCTRPEDPLFDLRPITTAFYDFPSILRYPAEVQEPRSLLAVNEFLGNPLFFYVHQGFFAKGIGAFDSVADEVNGLEPGTEWRSLGYIAARLYLIRRRGDSQYDVFTFSSSADLQNASQSPAVYQVTKRESTPLLIQAITVNGQPVPYSTDHGMLHAAVTVPAGGRAHFAVLYKDTTNLAAVDIAHHSARVYLLRMASDFRDIEMSHFGLGEVITAWYYEHNESPLRVIAFAALLAATLAGAAWSLLSLVRHRKASGLAR